jgi:predicted GIY-YIG superfamily endonuclease
MESAGAARREEARIKRLPRADKLALVARHAVPRDPLPAAPGAR